MGSICAARVSHCNSESMCSMLVLYQLDRLCHVPNVIYMIATNTAKFFNLLHACTVASSSVTMARTVFFCILTPSCAECTNVRDVHVNSSRYIILVNKIFRCYDIFVRFLSVQKYFNTNIFHTNFLTWKFSNILNQKIVMDFPAITSPYNGNIKIKHDIVSALTANNTHYGALSLTN